MNDGWYRITATRHPVPAFTEAIVVEYVFGNRCGKGSVSSLVKEGYFFEEVEVLTKQELNQRIENALKVQGG